MIPTMSSSNIYIGFIILHYNLKTSSGMLNSVAIDVKAKYFLYLDKEYPAWTNSNIPIIFFILERIFLKKKSKLM